MAIQRAQSKLAPRAMERDGSDIGKTYKTQNFDSRTWESGFCFSSSGCFFPHSHLSDTDIWTARVLNGRIFFYSAPELNFAQSPPLPGPTICVSAMQRISKWIIQSSALLHSSPSVKLSCHVIFNFETLFCIVSSTICICFLCISHAGIYSKARTQIVTQIWFSDI